MATSQYLVMLILSNIPSPGGMGFWGGGGYTVKSGASPPTLTLPRKGEGIDLSVYLSVT